MAYKFLIVDDSNIVRKVIIKTLALTDIKVDTILEAPNGLVALETLRSNPIDLVFLDINMPVMNGIEFMENLRSDADLKGLPVVIISTEGSKDRIDALEKLGIEAYLRKPVSPEQISETVHALLGGTQ